MQGLFSKPLLGAFLLIANVCVGAQANALSARPMQSAVATAHPLATAAGEEILRRGGNAFDAAVAVSATLAVVEPQSSGLGGGGFWLLHRASDGFEVMIDGRERAPLAASRDMYLDADGNVIPGGSVDGPLAAAIPGLPEGLDHIARRFGRLALQESLAPAIYLAEEGVSVGPVFPKLAQMRLAALSKGQDAAKLFLKDGQPLGPGELLKQPDLALTLRAIAENGRNGFYAGEIAERLVAGVRDAGGIWSIKDLQDYRIAERRPIISKYKGIRITSAPPPSSGGLLLAQMLNQLEEHDLAKFENPRLVHLLAEIMRRAYRDRAEYLGDADFVDVPRAMLQSKDYAAGLNQSIRMDRATPSSELAPTFTPEDSGQHTSHFSIIDGEGNRVAATLTINYPFGSGFMPAGTGVLLNNEMDDFSVKPGTPNLYGLVGAEANAIQPWKRPLSSMTPTFLDAHDRVAVLGTPGGSRIISMVLMSTLAFANGADAATMVGLPRLHHQYLPDQIEFEPDALTPENQAMLHQYGHALSPVRERYGDMQVVIWDRVSGQLEAASDPRGIGKAVVSVGTPLRVGESTGLRR
ncbi:MAG: gamma-glutamyltransferase [Thiotrichales bacterium]